MSRYVLYNGTFVDENELYHYGVPGMRWGVRRALSKSASNERLRK